MKNVMQGERNGEEFKCRCGRVIGHFVSHWKYPSLYSLDMGNGNIAETHHGRCSVCKAGVHFDFHWELAARLFKTDMEVVASWDVGASEGDKTIRILTGNPPRKSERFWNNGSPVRKTNLSLTTSKNMQTKKEETGGRKPSPRALRYGKLVRGWDWRTTHELLERAEKTRLKMKLSKTEFLERAIKDLIERA